MEKEVKERMTYELNGIKKEITIYEDTSAIMEYFHPKSDKKVIVRFPAVGSIKAENIINQLKEIHIQKVMNELLESKLW